MGSETYVDVSWRGLEVGRRVPLRAIGATSARLDHGAPMPVGTGLALRTDDGLEVHAVVVRVYEPVTGAAEVAGMQIAPKLDGEARAWWQARVEAAPDVASAGSADRVAIDRSPVAAMRREPAPPVRETPTESAIAPESVDDAANTEVMPAMTEEALAAIEARAEAAFGDDAARTQVMSAAEVAEIADSASGPVPLDDEDEELGPDSGPIANGAPADGRAKKRRGSSRRRKR